MGPSPFGGGGISRSSVCTFRLGGLGFFGAELLGFIGTSSVVSSLCEEGLDSSVEEVTSMGCEVEALPPRLATIFALEAKGISSSERSHSAEGFAGAGGSTVFKGTVIPGIGDSRNESISLTLPERYVLPRS